MNNNYPFISEYIAHSASDDLKNRVARTVKWERRKSACLKSCGGIVAAMLVASTTIFNLSPSLAQAASDVPVLGSYVKIITLNRFVSEDNNFSARVDTPKIEGLNNKELEAKLNSEFKEYADSIIAEYNSDVADMKKEFGDDTDAHMGFESGYIVNTNNDNYLSIDIYYVNLVGSSSTTHTHYTVDKKHGKLLTLSDLFAPNADYVGAISQYIKGEMARLNREEDGLFWIEGDEMSDSFISIAKDQNFYINSNGDLVICFNKYEVAAGAQGCPEFIIPDTVITKLKV